MERVGHRTRTLRSHFILKSYFLFLLFTLLSIGQYILIMRDDTLSRFAVDHIELVLTCFFMALMLLTIFVFVENVRFLLPLNWILAVIIVEGFVLGVARSLTNMTLDVLLVCLAFAAILTVLCICLATCSTHDFTLDVIIIFVLSFIFLIAAVYFVLLFVVAQVEFSLYIYSGLVTFILCIFLMYHTQTINGGRYAELRLADYILAALILYIDFTILLMLSLYFVPKIWNAVHKEEE